MRVALVADIHGKLPALEAVVRDFSRPGIDAVVNLGDSVSGPLLPLETVEPSRVRAATLPEIDERLGKVDAERIACGHTHTPRVGRASTGQLIVNPGRVGLQAYDDILPCPHVIEVGSPDARYAVAERLKDGWVASLITVPYPYKALAKFVASRQRPDWARALLSGYM